MNQKFPVRERLKSHKLIQKIFLEGKNVSKYPLKVFYAPSSLKDVPLAQAGFSVGKRNFKKAVDRNRIKRLLKETYRLKKVLLFNNLSTPYAFMFLYLGKNKPDFDEMEKQMEQLLIKLLTKISDHETN